ncbi:hypothetical protein [Microbacterium saperdae]|uniref:Uncharacterized protein n=1 Tax=Microbacterium saperdae TaxID=69368 RepID=A0A543BQL3_9MICO|nr:hypothetical protein [Microbacterium saperdae]TQL87107.1 hypothetical protein FB560_2774 [Microbacterium saperdae]GGM42846.1 hypothetical protein GCM10010489_12420 [Microbacterium saperdae]
MVSSKSEQAELRELQRKAYGRDGGLTDAEARRLRELERAVVASVSAASVASVPVLPVAPLAPERPPADRGTVAVDAGGPGPDAAAGWATVSDEGGSATPSDDGGDTAADAPGGVARLRALLRGHGGVITVAAVLLLAIGIGAGWALFGSRGDDIPLTEAQQQRKLELYEKGGYDEGSVRAVGQDDDALVWYGTKSDGADICLVLDVAKQSGENCQPFDDLTTFSLSAMTMVPGEGDEAPTGVMAYLMYSTAGVPLVSIQRWDQSYGVLEQFAGAERARAQELMDGDEAMNLAVVGYFRERPVWLIDRWNGNGSETCLIVDGAEGRSTCRPNEDALSDGIAVYVSDDEVVPGGELDASAIWSLEVEYTPSQTPYLTIIHDPESISVSTDGEMRLDGSRLELGGEYGDPIEVVPPSTDSKG